MDGTCIHACQCMSYGLTTTAALPGENQAPIYVHFKYGSHHFGNSLAGSQMYGKCRSRCRSGPENLEYPYGGEIDYLHIHLLGRSRKCGEITEEVNCS